MGVMGLGVGLYMGILRAPTKSTEHASTTIIFRHIYGI